MFTQKTLAQLLTIDDETIRRNALSILKRFQSCKHERYMAYNSYEATKQEMNLGQCTVCGILKPWGMK